MTSTDNFAVFVYVSGRGTSQNGMVSLKLNQTEQDGNSAPIEQRLREIAKSYKNAYVVMLFDGPRFE